METLRRSRHATTDQQTSANKRGSTSIRSRSWSLRRYITWKTLRRKRTCLWVDQRQTITVDRPREEFFPKRKICTSSCPEIFEFILCIVIVGLGCTGEDDRPFRLWSAPLLPEAIVSWLKLQECPFEHCPIAFHWRHSRSFLSTQTFLPFWLLVTPSFRTLKFRVLIFSSVWRLTIVFNLDQLGASLFSLQDFL